MSKFFRIIKQYFEARRIWKKKMSEPLNIRVLSSEEMGNVGYLTLNMRDQLMKEQGRADARIAMLSEMFKNGGTDSQAKRFFCATDDEIAKAKDKNA